MKRCWLAWMALISMACGAQDTSLSVLKGQIYTQNSAGAPALIPNGGAVFVASAPGLSGPPLAPAVEMKLPGGATQALTYSSENDTFGFTVTADSAAALTAKYPAGSYSLTFQGGVLNGTGATLSLPADKFPAPIQVVNFAALQSIDVSSDFALQLQLPPGAAQDDKISLTVLSGSTGVLSDFASGDQQTLTISSGALSPGQTLEIRIRYTRVTVDTTSVLPGEAGFFSETRLVAKTTSGTGPTDVTPPTLNGVSPLDGAVNVQPTSFFIFQFSEAMDPTRLNIAWSPALDPAKLNKQWLSDNSVLMLSYSGGFPAGLISWTLNPVAGAPTNFRDVAGNELAAGVNHGTFTVSGGGTGCEGTDPVEAAGFGILKLVSHLQNDAGAPVDDTINGAMIQAFSRIPNAAGRAALEFPADPAPKPHQLKFFTTLPGSELFFVQFPGRTELDAAYPAGDYDFQLRDSKTPTLVVSHVVLQLLANGYPSAPHFGNFGAAQTIDTNLDFTLSWDAFANAVANVDGLSLDIEDASGKTILQLPDNCAQKPLAVTATSTVIPKGLLQGGGSNYTATLTFTKLNDHGKTMPGSTAQGFAAVGRSTRMPLRTKTSSTPPPTAPIVSNPRLSADGGHLEFTVDFTVGHPLVIEAAPGAGQPFSSNITTNPPASPVTLSVPTTGQAFLFRARSN